MILENINYFQEVVSPLYAFPVVGVVLCALLVFAFGFKTPAQPPSFDFVENRKVATKKKTKSKDIKTSKPVQNGSAHASDSTSTSIPAKAQNAKPIKTETPVTKKNVPVETKSKTKKQDVPNSEKSMAKPDTNEEVPDNSGIGEWTQKLSRKDRKNKKGKDVGVSLKNTINLLTTSPKVIKSKENKTTIVDKKESDDQKNEEDQKSTKNIENIENIENKENIDDNEISEDKKNVQVKEKLLADDVAIKDASQDEPSSKKPKKKKKDAQVPIPDHPPPESKGEPETETKSTKEASKKSVKSGSKSQNVEIKELAAEMQLESSPKKVTEKEAEKPLPTPDATESAVDSPKEEDSAKPTSNVVFDELGDMWQDAKPQKKKKKARRE